RPPPPAARALVAALASRADQPVLLKRIDDLLEAEDVRLEGGHVGEEQRQPLVPAVGGGADVQGGDVDGNHGPKCARPARTGCAARDARRLRIRPPRPPSPLAPRPAARR